MADGEVLRQNVRVGLREQSEKERQEGREESQAPVWRGRGMQLDQGQGEVEQRLGGGTACAAPGVLAGWL